MRWRHRLAFVLLAGGCTPDLEDQAERANEVMGLAQGFFENTPPEKVVSGRHPSFDWSAVFGCDRRGTIEVTVELREAESPLRAIDLIDRWVVNFRRCDDGFGEIDGTFTVDLERVAANEYQVSWVVEDALFGDCRMEATALLNPPDFSEMRGALCGEEYPVDALNLPTLVLLGR